MKLIITITIFLISSFMLAQTPQSREFVKVWGLGAQPNYDPIAEFGLEYGVWDKVNFINGATRGGKSSYNLVVNQFILATNASVVYQNGKSLDGIGSFAMEFRRTTRKRDQIQVGIGPAYIIQFDNKALPLVNDSVVYTSGIAPLVYIGLGEYRNGKHKFQFWHVRLSNYFLIQNGSVSLYPTLALRLGFHKKPID